MPVAASAMAESAREVALARAQTAARWPSVQPRHSVTLVTLYESVARMIFSSALEPAS